MNKIIIKFLLLNAKKSCYNANATTNNTNIIYAK